jgi:hypothetical protein
LQNQSGEDDPLDKIDEYRRLATARLELARDCTFDKDRAALLQMALTLSGWQIEPPLETNPTTYNKPPGLGPSFFGPLLR